MVHLECCPDTYSETRPLSHISLDRDPVQNVHNTIISSNTFADMKHYLQGGSTQPAHDIDYAHAKLNVIFNIIIFRTPAETVIFKPFDWAFRN